MAVKKQKQKKSEEHKPKENQTVQDELKEETEISGEKTDEAVSSWEDERRVLTDRLAELEQENAELRDSYLRKQADFDNFRKRMFREKEESIRYANKELLSALIPVIDDFERALQSAEVSRDFESFYPGVKLIEKQFVGMLEKQWGLKRMECLNQEFDPQEHEAVMMIESPDYDVQTVVEDFQKGYYYQDRVLRHAKVKVAVPAKQEETDQ